MNDNTPDFHFTVCICTRNRPDSLRNALGSVLGSAHKIHQIVVSDDSTDDRTRDMVADSFPMVRFVEGDRRGLGANRNSAVRAATGSHVLFIDDDVLLAPDFFDQVAFHLKAEVTAGRTILTGTELNNGTTIRPHGQNFLGFQNVNYRPQDRIYSIVINATVFPRAIFDRLIFDENLVYGYEEVDFSARAVFRHGFEIALVPIMMNQHFPSRINRGFYEEFTEASRIYATFKKYWWVERARAKALLFLASALPHNLAFNLRHRGIAGLRSFWATMRYAVAYISACSAAPEKFV